MTIRLGLQIPNFSYGTGVDELFPTVIAQAQEAEAAGFDSVFVMDHFYQLPVLGTPDQPMLEAYTALGGLATATERVQLGTLVTGNTYRNPTLLAKAITTLDVMSQGRAILGIGTGWFELEHDQLGFEFGTFTERFNKLDEALQIILPMIKGERPTFSGKYYRTEVGDGRTPLPRPHSADDRRQRREEDDSAGRHGTSTTSTSSPASTSCRARSRWSRSGARRSAVTRRRWRRACWSRRWSTRTPPGPDPRGVEAAHGRRRRPSRSPSRSRPMSSTRASTA